MSAAANTKKRVIDVQICSGMNDMLLHAIQQPVVGRVKSRSLSHITHVFGSAITSRQRRITLHSANFRHALESDAFT